MSSSATPSIAVLLSLLGGIVITAGSVIAALLSGFGSPYEYYYGMGPGMMRGYGYGFGSFSTAMLIEFSVVALVCGIIVVVAAAMLRVNPSDHTTWGIVILIFSLGSFIGMGGYFIGALLGITGGALALSWRVPTKNTSRN